MAWKGEAATWAAVARDDQLDPFFWHVNRPAIADLLPPPCSGPVIDVGTGEGRVLRLLEERGHAPVGVDLDVSMLHSAGNMGSPLLAARATHLPLATGAVAGATCVMVLMSVDHFEIAIKEMARVLVSRGWLLLSVLHPLITSGQIDDAGILSVTDYGHPRELPLREVDRGGHALRFQHIHRPLAAYLQATLGAGLDIDSVGEPLPDSAALADHPRLRRWRSIPNAVLWRARKRY